ncbi:hypothetical protein SAMD00023353_0500680 [Rosellinia necatrix]|uniref:Uncharacterized protein n=1 Tax=Rosellinia necatrix TaxID=77044 RepID=A0A1S8A5S8_ROSNE|nr:hypothetical protein SAMD00023353_0500680 [Rosellinia necatrix]
MVKKSNSRTPETPGTGTTDQVFAAERRKASVPPETEGKIIISIIFLHRYHRKNDPVARITKLT